MRSWLAIPCVAVALLVGGCFVHPPTHCLAACAAQHQSCVTRAQSDNALQWCDYHQTRCTNGCYGR